MFRPTSTLANPHKGEHAKQDAITNDTELYSRNIVKFLLTESEAAEAVDLGR
jgi:hypothetical protein